jgi:hypothetical protein
MNSNDNSSFSRRQMVGAVGGSFAVATAGSPAFAQTAAQETTAQPMTDPTKKYLITHEPPPVSGICTALVGF